MGKAKRITLYDSVDLGQIPGDAKAVAGYVNGSYVTFPELKKRFPHAHHLSISVAGITNAHARCVDVEPSDATNETALIWLRHHKHKRKPIIYTSLSNAQQLKNYLSAHGFKVSEYYLWTAHYTYREHICDSSCGYGFKGKADATQWTNKAHGRNLDQSICSPHFF